MSSIGKVTDMLYRGPRPSAFDYDRLLTLEIKSVINLEDNQEAIVADRLRALQRGIVWYSKPWSEIKRPHPSDIRVIVNLIEFENRSGNKVFIHCKHGQDRTGYAVAGYRMLMQGWTFERAYKEARDMGHKWWFAPYLLFWPKSLKDLR